MGLWSSIKNVAKKVWNGVKAAVRVVVKVIIVELLSFVINLLFSWLPVKKKLRLQILILRDETNAALVPEADLNIPLSYAISTFNDKFNVKIIAYGDPIVQTLTKPAPTAALEVGCDGFVHGAFGNEWGEAGAYFASHLAGWNFIPISLGFPITVFVVRDIDGKIGCSLGMATDYVTLGSMIQPNGNSGVLSDSTLVHELGHACNLNFHRDNMKNLMYPDHGRGNDVTGWQKFVVRNSRHCTFW